MNFLKKTLARSAAVLTAFPLFLSTVPTRADDHIGRLGLSYWTYGVDGNATVKGSSADIDETDKMLTGNNNGFVLEGERRFESWGMAMDLFMGKQKGSRQISSSEEAEWDAEFAALTADAFLSFIDKEFEGGDAALRVDGLAGLRGYMNSYKIEFEPYNPANDKSRSDYVNWVDPMVGLRLVSQVTPIWAVELYGDMGGFGVGSASELSVLSQASVVWSVSEALNVMAGYRFFKLDSGEESGDRRTTLDVTMQGPTLGVEARF